MEENLDIAIRRKSLMDEDKTSKFYYMLLRKCMKMKRIFKKASETGKMTGEPFWNA